jgi:CheY-like chemotaxis protein
MSSHPRANILVADDEPSVRQLLGVILGAHYDVHTVSDGLEVLEYVKDHTPDLVILDVSMPGMDGLEVCSRLRRINRFLGTAIIILTAETDNRTRDSARLFGADAFVEKPLLARPLLKQVAELLETYRVRAGR